MYNYSDETETKLNYIFENSVIKWNEVELIPTSSNLNQSLKTPLD